MFAVRYVHVVHSKYANYVGKVNSWSSVETVWVQIHIEV